MRVLLGALFALLYALAFPFRAGDLHFDLGTALGPVALIPLILALRGLSPARAFRLGFGFGTAAFVGILFWIYVVVHDHGGASRATALLAVLLLAASQGLFVGAAGALAAALERRAGPLALAVLPAAWVVAEHLRGAVPLGGFPWALLGYSAWLNGPLRELAALGGVYGLSLLLAMCSALAARRRLVTALGVLAIAHALGFVWGGLQLDPAPGGPELPRVAVVQANIAQGVKWDPAAAASSFERHLEGSRLAAAAARVDLIVWPESSVTASIEEEQVRGALQELARETGATLLVGTVTIEALVEPVRTIEDLRFFNSLYAIAPDGSFIERYDKSRLVPFGEYLPLRSFLGLFIEAVARGANFSDLTPGPGARSLSSLPGFGSELGVAPLICYEAIYPSVVREAVRAGARVLVNATNDAWYGRSSAPHQFLAITTLRSAEHGLPLVRAANTGVSAIVAAGGRVEYQTPIFEEQQFARTLPGPREHRTPYTRLGDWVVWLCWLGLGVGIVREGAFRVRRREQ